MVRCPKCGREYDSEKLFCALDGTQLEKEEDSEKDIGIGDTVVGDRYRIIAKLGEGGMGSVFLARHEILADHVALKVLQRVISEETDLIRRFILEARATARVAHPNIVSIHDFGYDATEGYYLVMEYVEGPTLEDLIERETPLAQSRAIHLLQQLLSALAVAHDAGVIHRDLKPANIALTSRLGNPEHVKILDFGLAKVLDVSGGQS